MQLKNDICFIHRTVTVNLLNHDKCFKRFLDIAITLLVLSFPPNSKVHLYLRQIERINDRAGNENMICLSHLFPEGKLSGQVNKTIRYVHSCQTPPVRTLAPGVSSAG